jgi:hypothetical protein
MLASVQASLVQATSHLLHQGFHGGPSGGLPNTVLFLTHRSRIRTLCRMVE